MTISDMLPLVQTAACSLSIISDRREISAYQVRPQREIDKEKETHTHREQSDNKSQNMHKFAGPLYI